MTLIILIRKLYVKGIISVLVYIIMMYVYSFCYEFYTVSFI